MTLLVNERNSAIERDSHPVCETQLRAISLTDGLDKAIESDNPLMESWRIALLVSFANRVSYAVKMIRETEMLTKRIRGPMHINGVIK